MNITTKVGGVILAGGLSKRMNQQDKGLILFKTRPMISYCIAAMTSVANETVISANNHNLLAYQGFNLPVITDQTKDLNGPLAGILAALEYFSDYSSLLVAPCDCPLIKPEHLKILLESKNQFDAEIAVATEGHKLQPLFLAISTTLRSSLKKYLIEGNRKVISWLEFHSVVRVDFSDKAELFFNVNSFDDLTLLKKSYS